MQFDNVWILLCWIYWFYAKRQKFVRLYKFIFSKRIQKEWENNTKIFSITKKVKMKVFYCVICGKYRKLKHLKVLSIICSKCKNEEEKTFKEE